MSLYVTMFLSIYLFINLSEFVHIYHRFLYLSKWVFIPFCSSVLIFIFLSTPVYKYLSCNLFLFLSISLISVYLYIYIYLFLSVRSDFHMIWKSDLTDKMKRSFFQAAVVSILLYGCTSWVLTKRLKNKLDGNYTRMLRAILNKSWRQHSTRHQLYGQLPPITKTIQGRQTRHVEHCCISRYELISDVLLWTPTHGRAKAGRPARTYIQQLCEDTGCSLEDLPEAMNDREKWREMVRDIHASSTTWWWWFIYRILSKSTFWYPLSCILCFINLSRIRQVMNPCYQKSNTVPVQNYIFQPSYWYVTCPHFLSLISSYPSSAITFNNSHMARQ